MDIKSVKDLQILHEVSRSEHVNQRYLSKKLGMSSGLVNLYIKRLAHKGYIKIKGTNPRRLKYLITPRGITEKTRLTYEFAVTSYKYFKSATDEIKKKLRKLEQAGVYGTGELAEMCLLLVKEFDIQVVAVVDDHAESSRFHGFPVVPRDVLRNLKFDKFIVAKMEGAEEVAFLAKDALVEEGKILWILDPPS
jgi:predicted transcriptional regulator